MNQRLVLIGEVERTHGIKGKIKAKVFSEPDIFMHADSVLLGKDEESALPYRMVSSEVYRGSIVLSLIGVDTVNSAETLRGCRIYAEKDSFRRLPEGEYYQFEILGIRVFTDGNRYLGTIQDIIRTGSNDVYVVREAETEYLIPAIDDVVLEVDVPQSRMVIRPIKGLLDEE